MYIPDTWRIGEKEIGRYLAGEATPEEAMALDEWLKASAVNQALFDNYVQAWQAGKSSEKILKENAWQELKAALPASPLRQQKAGRTIPLFKKLSIAAILTGLIAVATIIYLRVHPADNERIIASAGSIKKELLPDGSSVVLNNNSNLRLPKKFDAARRQTRLEGEAFFDVAHNTRQPFLIDVDEITIQVVGTSFNVKEQDETIETQVATGLVKMFNSKDGIYISAGQTGVYDKKTSRFFVRDELDINRFGYATRNFEFTNERLADIIGYLEKAYSQKIVLDNALLANCKMTSSFYNKSLDYVLEVIAATLDLTYSYKDGVLHIGGDHEGC